MTRELLKQALEALQLCANGEDDVLLTRDTLSALREALDQPKQEPFEYWNAVEGWVKIDEIRQHFDSVGCGTIYKTAGYGRVPLAIAQSKEPKQEPVRDPLADEQAQETELKQLRERVQELEERCDDLAADKGTYFRLYEALCIKAESDKKANKQVVTDLYTEQPTREWVRLDKDMNVVYLDIDLATTGPRSPYTTLAIEVWNKAIKHAADNFEIDDDHYYDQVRESILENKK